MEQIDLKTGKVLKVFASGADAAREYYISPNAISACCNGRRISAAGYQWRFAAPKVAPPPTQTPPPAHLPILQAAPPQIPPPQIAPESPKTPSAGVDAKVRISEAAKPVLIPVQQLDIETGAVIQVYSSCIDAARSVGIHANAVFACCCGRRLFAGGYSWKFLTPSSPNLNGANMELFKKLPGSIDLHGPPAVEQLDVRSRLIKVYSDVFEASKSVGIDSRLLAMCCRDQKLAGGYFWRFKKNPPIQENSLPKLGENQDHQPPRTIKHALLADLIPPRVIPCKAPENSPSEQVVVEEVVEQPPVPPPAPMKEIEGQVPVSNPEITITAVVPEEPPPPRDGVESANTEPDDNTREEDAGTSPLESTSGLIVTRPRTDLLISLSTTCYMYYPCGPPFKWRM